jgi:hypothetical protein
MGATRQVGTCGVLAAIAAVMVAASSALAGGGYIDQAAGSMRLEAHFRFQPTQQQVALAQASISRAAALLCDATDGGVRIREVRLSAAEADADTANLWIQALPGRSGGAWMADGSSLGRLGSRIDLFEGALERPDLLAHVLAHHALGLGDQYDEQRRYSGACGVGPGFDAGSLDERNHSLMQAAGGLRCGGGSNSGRACLHASDCPGGTCRDVLASEFSAPANHDRRRAEGAVCPPARALSRIRISGTLPRSHEPRGAFDASDYLSAEATSSHLVHVEAIDALGQLPATDLRLYFTNVEDGVWQLTAVVDSAVLGREPGTPAVVGQWRLGFHDNGALASYGAERPKLVLDGLASGAAAMTVLVEVGTPNPDPQADPALGFDGLQATRSGRVKVAATWDGSPGCLADWCERAWNLGTGRWETTEQSLLHGGASDWETLVRNFSFLELPDGLPSEQAPPECEEAPDFVSDLHGAEQILVVLDASESMGFAAAERIREVCDNGRDDDVDGSTDETPCADSRWAFATSATLAFAELVADAGVQVGVSGFDDAAKLLTPIAAVSRGWSMRLAEGLDRRKPTGNTALGLAVSSAYDEFERVQGQGRSRSAILLTDGRTNAGPEPQRAGRSLEGRRVRWFPVALGDGVDAPLLADLAAGSGGVVAPAASALDLPTVMAELAARVRGRSMVMARQDFAVSAAQRHRKRSDHEVSARAEFDLAVEEGADELLVFVGGRNPRQSSWRVLYDLLGPGGERYDRHSPEVHEGRGWTILRVRDPRPGAWKLRVLPGGVGVHRSSALAWTANPRADLFVDALPRLVARDGGAVASLEVAYQSAIEGDVSLEARLVGAAGGVTPVAFERQAFGDARVAALTPHRVRGFHRLEVSARVGEGARPASGESIFEGPERAPVRVVPFERHAFTTLWVDAEPVACSRTDCDNDGIASATEDALGPDCDGDGLPNSIDPDSDDDDLPDAFEGTADSDGDGLADLCDPRGAPDSLAPVLEAQRKARRLACTDQARDSAENLRTASLALARLTQSLGAGAPRDPAVRHLVETLREAAASAERAGVIADVLPEFCEKFDAALAEAMELEEGVADEVSRLLAARAGR